MNHTPRLLAFSALLACACATRVVAPLAASGQAADVDRKLAAIVAFSAQVRDRQPVIENGVRGSELLSAAAAVQAVLAVKARVLDEFRDPRFVAVHDTLDDAFKRTVGENHLEYTTALSGEKAVTSTSFQEALKEIADLVRDVTNRADVRTTFLVHTEPAGATFEICPQYLTTGCIHVTTDATIADIFRGLYTYRVSLDGYQTVAYPLDLVHFTQTRLDCRLQAKRASPCTPR